MPGKEDGANLRERTKNGVRRSPAFYVNTQEISLHSSLAQMLKRQAYQRTLKKHELPNAARQLRNYIPVEMYQLRRSREDGGRENRPRHRMLAHTAVDGMSGKIQRRTSQNDGGGTRTGGIYWTCVLVRTN